MSGDKKKAVPSWKPHAMPGMLKQAGPSEDAREQLIKEGVWRSDTPNHEIGPSGPRRQVSAEGVVSLSPEAPGKASFTEQVEPAEQESLWNNSEPTANPASNSIGAPGLQQPHKRSAATEKESVAATPVHNSSEFQQGVAPTPVVPEWRRSDATGSVGTTPSGQIAENSAGVAATPDYKAQPVRTGVAPTPAPSRRHAEPSVVPTPAPSRRQPAASVAPTPVSQRRQRYPDAEAAPPPKATDRRRADTSSSVGPAPPRPSTRRNSAAPGRVQSPRYSTSHEADGRVRRTLRITRKVDQHLHDLAALLGLDMNGALSVAIVEHHLYLLNRPSQKG